jgi:hypothetical protein
MRTVSAKLKHPLRDWLTDFVGQVDLPGRIRRHVEQCPRCQRRLGRHAKLVLAMQLLKTQPHPMALLLEANRRTMAYLQRSVRELPRARRLQTRLPGPSIWSRVTAVTQSALSAAACLLVLLAVRMVIDSSISKVEKGSVQTVKHLQSYIDEYDGPATGGGAGHAA